MSKDTIAYPGPKHCLPVYTAIKHPMHNDYSLGEVYEMNIEEPDRAKDRGQKPPYNHVHDSLLIAKRRCKVEDIDDILLAFDKDTRDKDEAVERIHSHDGEAVILVFLRLDKAKGMVTEGLEAVHETMTKEDIETEVESDRP